MKWFTFQERDLSTGNATGREFTFDGVDADDAMSKALAWNQRRNLNTRIGLTCRLLQSEPDLVWMMKHN